MREYITLIDLQTGYTDAIIISDGVSKEEIEFAIAKIKTDLEGEWTIDDIADGLPEGCTMIYQPDCIYY